MMRCFIFCAVLLLSTVLLCESRKRHKHPREEESNRGSGSARNIRTNLDTRTVLETRSGSSKQKLQRSSGADKTRHRLQTGSNRYDSRNSEEERKELLRSTMRHMFGFEHMDTPRVHKATIFDVESLTERGSNQFSREEISRNLFSSLQQDPIAPSNRFLPNPPDFMLELYRSYSKDKNVMQIHAQNQGNTVRSFFSIAGESPENLRDKGKPMIIIPYTRSQSDGAAMTESRSGVTARHNQMRVFAFNVTSIPTTETIVAAELRLDGLRSRALRYQQSGLNPSSNATASGWTAVLSVYQVSNAEENETRNVYQRVGDMVTLRPNSSFSWIDSSIARLASHARESGRILIVKFNHHNAGGLLRKKRSSFRPMSNNPDLEMLSSRDSSPNLPSYFVVLADRSKRNSGDRRGMADSVGLTPILIVYCNDTTTKVTTPSSPQVSNEILTTLQSLNVSAKRSRFRRSSERIHDSSLETSSDESSNELPGESGRQETVAPAIEDNDQTELHDNGRSERRVMQSLKDRKSIKERKRKGKKKGRSRKCRKRTRKGKKSKSCKNKSASSDAEVSLNRAQQSCSRKSLNVDFQDMGWSDWIISPKSFEAYYCSGVCAFDTMKKANPSNHAIIQAFINAFEINTEVPAPCCVPDKLMSLSVLFFDQNSNVVLKVFPNMSVESCACR